MQDYQEFLKSKRQTIQISGFNVDADALNPQLHLYQRDVVRWSLRLGKSAIFAAVGLGKTFMQLEWAKHVIAHTGESVLVLAPLAVSHQTIREAQKFGITAQYAPDQSAIGEVGLYVTNYERLEKFDLGSFSGVVLDESSILKSFTGKTKQLIIESFKDTPYKLACSATPAPNDYMELGSHAEFLDTMARDEMLARWFVHDSANTAVWRLKGHATEDFWQWVTSFAVCMTRPADLGNQYHLSGYDLPPLNLIAYDVPMPQASIDSAWERGRLMPDTNPSSTDLARVKRESLPLRIAKVKEIVEAVIPQDEPIVIWCHLNDESAAITAAIPSAVEVKGSDSPETKAERLLGFSDGTYRILVTKPSIAGFGMNWQHCANPIFLGVDYSFESMHQAIGRSLRYGQTRTVNAHVVFSETEGGVVETIENKRVQFEKMQLEMAQAMNRHGLFRDDEKLNLTQVAHEQTTGDGWTMHLGDCVTVAAMLPDNSVDYGVHSPPFEDLYIYSDSEADMGNSSGSAEFFTHYRFLIREMHRITAPGRLCSVHCKDLPMYMNRDGSAGLRDFPGEIIRAFEAEGWQFHSRVTIWKDPVIEMQRTKNHGLLHKNFVKEANAVRQGMADYVITFRKWAGIENQVPVTQHRVADDYIGTAPPAAPMDGRDRRRYSIEVWQRYASPVWFDIDQTRVLNYQMAKDNRDEKHICPLQLDVIERCIDLWSNPGDVVFSPFAGIGSEGDGAIRLGRKFVGIELKPSYYRQACKFLGAAELAAGQQTLFDLDSLA